METLHCGMDLNFTRSAFSTIFQVFSTLLEYCGSISIMGFLWGAVGLKSSRGPILLGLNQFQPSLSRTVNTIKMAFTSFDSNETDRRSPPIIIMHGLFGSKQNWRGIGKALEKKMKLKVYSVDARNHGDSPHVPEHSSAHMAADIAELMRMEGLSTVSLVGHSMGGRTAMFFALKYPQLVERAIIVDISPVAIPSDFSVMDQILLAMKNISIPPNVSMAEGRLIAEEQIKNAVGDKGTVDFIMLNLRKLKTGEFAWALNIDALHRNLRHFRNFEKEIEGMNPFHGPVMFICGKKSNFVDPDDWPKIQRIFPNSELHWLDAGHLVHFDQPTEFVSLVTKFLQH